MKVKIGLIGCGGISRRHIDAYLSLKDLIEIKATVDIVVDKARNAAEKVGAEKYYRDYIEMLEKEDIDAVDICLPHSLHSRVSIDAMHYGKNILCEKPIARNLIEAERMIEVSKKTGKILMIGENWRFMPWTNMVKKLIDEKIIGRPFLAKSEMLGYPLDLATSGWKTRKKEVGGGVTIDSGIHNIDIVRWVMGDVTEVTALSNRIVRGEIEGEDTSCILFKHKNDAISTLILSWAVKNPFTVDLLEIYGDGGSLKGFFDRVEVKNRERKIFSVRRGSGFREEIRHFAQCILGVEKLRFPPEEAYKDLMIVDAIYKSMETGKTIKVEGNL